MKSENIFSQIFLAEASYALLDNVASGDQEGLQAALIANGFSQTQAEEFIKNWRVVHHQPDTIPGFSATLFESTDNPGEYTFAIRGTAGLQDLVITDVTDIVLDGKTGVTAKPGSETGFNQTLSIFMSSSNCKRNCHGPFTQIITA